MRSHSCRKITAVKPDAFGRVAQGFERGVVDVDNLIALNIAALPRNAETSFRSKGFFASETSDPDVWIDPERLTVLIEPAPPRHGVIFPPAARRCRLHPVPERSLWPPSSQPGS